MTVCNYCGADFAPGVNVRCRGCGLAPDLSVAPSLPFATGDGSDGGGDGEREIVFDLTDWPAADRVGFGSALDDAGVPWRWEPGPVLVTLGIDEAAVDAVLADIGAGDEAGDGEDLPAGGSRAGGEAGDPRAGDSQAGDEDDEDGEAWEDGDAWDGGDGAEEDGEDGDGDEEADPAAEERAQEAMSSLFDAADRLVHNPASGEIVDEVDALAGSMAESPPPFGIDRRAWDRMAELAGEVVEAAAGADEDSVAEAARRLRGYLREYV